MRKTLPLLAALAFTCLLSLPGCTVEDSAARKLEDNRQKWQQQDISDYDFTLRVICFCIEDVTRPVIIEVRGGAVQSMVYADDSTAVTTDYFDGIDTLEKLFQVLADAIKADAYQLIVDYHPDCGFPQKIDIDFLINAIDEEITYAVSGFTSYN